MDYTNIASRNEKVSFFGLLKKAIQNFGYNISTFATKETLFDSMLADAQNAVSKLTLTLKNASNAAITTANFQLDGSGTDFSYNGTTITPNSSGVAILPLQVKTASADYAVLILDGSDATLGHVNCPMEGDHESLTLQTVTFTTADSEESAVASVAIAIAGVGNDYYEGAGLDSGVGSSVTTLLPAGNYTYTATKATYDTVGPTAFTVGSVALAVPITIDLTE